MRTQIKYSYAHKIYHNLLRRDHFYKLLEYYRRTATYNNSQMELLKNELLTNLLCHANSTTQFYREILTKSFLTNDGQFDYLKFREIPFLTKDIVRENFDHLISTEVPPKRKIKNSTSGSTGTNFSFFSDRNSLIHRATLTARANEWAGIRIGARLLSIWGSRFDLAEAQNSLQKIKDLFKQKVMLSGYHLTDEDMFSYFQIIKEFKPDIINGYPSTLEFFSNFLLDNKLRYSPTCIRTEGETLYDYQRDIIMSAFNAPVYNYYSSRDITGIAHECSRHNGLHIFSENVFLEVVDDDGNPMEEGEGEVVLTDLHNYVMPFIRYKIGDRAVISKRRCDCGINLPLIEKVLGRTFELITFPNGNRVSGTFWTLLFRSKTGIKDFQVIQKSRDLIRIVLVITCEFDDSLKSYIIDKIKEYGGRTLNIKIDIVDEIEVTKSGKRKFIISEIM